MPSLVLFQYALLAGSVAGTPSHPLQWISNENCLSYLIFFQFFLSCLFLSLIYHLIFNISSYLISCCLILSGLFLSFIILSQHTLSPCAMQWLSNKNWLSYLLDNPISILVILSYLFLSYLIFSYLILSYHGTPLPAPQWISNKNCSLGLHETFHCIEKSRGVFFCDKCEKVLPTKICFACCMNYSYLGTNQILMRGTI